GPCSGAPVLPVRRPSTVKLEALSADAFVDRDAARRRASGTEYRHVRSAFIRRLLVRWRDMFVICPHTNLPRAEPDGSLGTCKSHRSLHFVKARKNLRRRPKSPDR